MSFVNSCQYINCALFCAAFALCVCNGVQRRHCLYLFAYCPSFFAAWFFFYLYSHIMCLFFEQFYVGKQTIYIFLPIMDDHAARTYVKVSHFIRFRYRWRWQIEQADGNKKKGMVYDSCASRDAPAIWCVAHSISAIECYAIQSACDGWRCRPGGHKRAMASTLTSVVERLQQQAWLMVMNKHSRTGATVTFICWRP